MCKGLQITHTSAHTSIIVTHDQLYNELLKPNSITILNPILRAMVKYVNNNVFNKRDKCQLMYFLISFPLRQSATPFFFF